MAVPTDVLPFVQTDRAISARCPVLHAARAADRKPHTRDRRDPLRRRHQDSPLHELTTRRRRHQQPALLGLFPGPSPSRRGSAKQERAPAVLVVRLAGVSGGVGVEHSSLSEAKSRQLIHHIAREI
ncbi:hypothetical protein ACRAWF_00230 [Streptomyces sp. L7]